MQLSTDFRGNGRATDETRAKPAEESKPSEESEGIPGYFLRPERIKSEDAEGKTRLTAPAGTVVGVAQEAEDVDLVAWSASGADVRDAQAAAGDGIEVARLKCFRAAHDGAFDVTIAAPADAVVLTLGEPCQERKILAVARQDETSKPRSLWSESPGRPFAPLVQSIQCLCAEGERWDAATQACVAFDGACDSKAAPQCGCDGTTYDNLCDAYRARVKFISGACR